MEQVEFHLKWTDDSGEAFLYFDAVESIDHSLTATYTESPVEDGSKIGDHAFNEPNQVTVAGWVSNTPLPSNPGVQSGDNERSTIDLGQQITNIELSTPEFPAVKPRLQFTGVQGVPIPNANPLVRLAGQSGNFGDFTEFPGPDRGIETVSPAVWAGSGGYQDRVQAAFLTIKRIKETFLTVRIQTPLWLYENMQITSVNIPEGVEDGSARQFTITFKEVLTATASRVDAPEPTVLRAKKRKRKAKTPKKDPQNAVGGTKSEQELEIERLEAEAREAKREADAESFGDVF